MAVAGALAGHFCVHAKHKNRDFFPNVRLGANTII